MKTPHLLAVAGTSASYAALFAYLEAAGMRVGWLDLTASAGPPPALEAAVAAGVHRAVEVTDGRTVVVKGRRGPAVLRDLLREHFLGCVLVLVRGGEDMPLLAAGEAEGDWRVEAAGETHELSSAALAARLRRPRPWPRSR
ncbi:MAG: hypothetical protein AAF604_17530 [Acidobacteriota bacterium]